jgi:GTP-binding protein
VVINKLDKTDQRANEVLDETFDLFVSLDANEEQLDFPVLYASGRSGWADEEVDGPRKNLNPLLDKIIDHVKPKELDKSKPFAMLSTLLYADSFLGRSLVGRISQGTAKANQTIKAINLKGEKVDEGRLTKIFRYEGTKKVPIEVGEAGDIVVVAGLEKANVADTICDLEVNEPIEATPIDPPTMSITITVNTSPLAGTEGKKLTSTQIRDRLIQEAQNNVGITFSENSGNDSFVVSGRGELMLEILLTQMRREGFEMTVSPPKVLYKKDENGNKLEPIEEITMDLDEEHSSKIIDSMNRRKGKLIELKDTGKNKKRLIFHAPTRGLMGYTSRFLTLTKGNGVINRIFHTYGPFEGDMEGRRNGALISMEQGKAVAFAIFNLQARGEMFVTHNDPVYPGMIVGLAPKPGDMIINVMKGKKLTNMRTQGTDENVVLTPVRKMSIAEQLSMLNTDEALEITPESCRLRKAILDPHERKRSEKAGAAA